MKDRIEIKTELFNYYGRVVFVDYGDECVMELDDWGEMQGIVISREFFESARKEFQK